MYLGRLCQPGWVRDYRDELLALLDEFSPTPDQLRRLAEVVEELVYDVQASLVWWQRAAEAGDPDAKDILELLRDDGLL